MSRPLNRSLLQTAIVIVCLALGAMFHFGIFGLSYFGSDIAWLVVGAKALVACLVGFVFGRFVPRPAIGLLLAYLCLQMGPILMSAWALFNYYETGRVGFNVLPWSLPAAIDLAVCALGHKMGIRRN